MSTRKRKLDNETTNSSLNYVGEKTNQSCTNGQAATARFFDELGFLIHPTHVNNSEIKDSLIPENLKQTVRTFLCQCPSCGAKGENLCYKNRFQHALEGKELKNARRRYFLQNITDGFKEIQSIPHSQEQLLRWIKTHLTGLIRFFVSLGPTDSSGSTDYRFDSDVELIKYYQVDWEKIFQEDLLPKVRKSPKSELILNKFETAAKLIEQAYKRIVPQDSEPEQASKRIVPQDQCQARHPENMPSPSQQVFKIFCMRVSTCVFLKKKRCLFQTKGT